MLVCGHPSFKFLDPLLDVKERVKEKQDTYAALIGSAHTERKKLILLGIKGLKR